VSEYAELGSRSSQLANCTVAHLLDDRLLVPASKKGRNGGKGGHTPIPLTPSLAGRLREAAKGRAADAPLFTQEIFEGWEEGSHKRKFEKARKAAGLPEGTMIYSLRHSSIARMLLRGLPIRLVADLALCRLCWRRAGALHGSQIEIEQRLLFVALVLVLLAQPKDFLEHFDVETLSLGFRENFLLPFIQRLDIFVDALNALDEGANAVAGNSCRICHACPSSSGGRRSMGQR
jgi:hypothetical protein